MGPGYLIDSNAIIEFLGGKLPDSGNEWLQTIVENEIHCISVINQIELLGFDGPQDEMQILEEFISTTRILPLTDEIVKQTIELRKALKIKLPDAVIAATALNHKLKLITRNISDFRYISELEVINPHELA